MLCRTEMTLLVSHSLLFEASQGEAGSSSEDPMDEVNATYDLPIDEY